MKDKFNPLPGSVAAGIRAHFSSLHFFKSLFSSLLGSRVAPALDLLGLSYDRSNASCRSRLDSISLLNLSLCRHIKQHSRVSLLKLIKLIRVGGRSYQVSQTFRTQNVFQITYQVLKIVHIIGQSVNYPKRLYTNHWSHLAQYR